MRGALIGIGLAIAIWAVAVIVLIALGRRSQARELATLIPNLLVLFRGLLRDPREVMRRTAPIREVRCPCRVAQGI
jgi:hypothetical protein